MANIYRIIGTRLTSDRVDAAKARFGELATAFPFCSGCRVWVESAMKDVSSLHDPLSAHCDHLESG